MIRNIMWIEYQQLSVLTGQRFRRRITYYIKHYFITMQFASTYLFNKSGENEYCNRNRSTRQVFQTYFILS